MTATMKRMRLSLTLLAMGTATVAFALKVHQDTDFTQKTISNIAVMATVTGLVTFVPEASAAMPVPFWQLTNYADAVFSTQFVRRASVVSLVSGECDTNIVEVLFSTNYVITGVCVAQPASVAQTLYVFTNFVSVESFALTSPNHFFTLSSELPVSRYHRLGLAVSATNAVVSFCVEGYRP